MTNPIYAELDSSILINDKEAVLAKLKELKTLVDAGDVETIEYICSPANLTKLHASLCENMFVVRRLLQLRGRVPNAAHRSSLFIQAMINAVGLCHAKLV